MVLDASAVWPEEKPEETPQERSVRISRLAYLVRNGGYAVQSHRLAMALLEWDPRRSNPRQAADVADRRRAYMRDYMRRRRAQLPPDHFQSAPTATAQIPPGDISPGYVSSA